MTYQPDENSSGDDPRTVFSLSDDDSPDNIDSELAYLSESTHRSKPRMNPLEIDSLTKQYDDVTAVNNLSLTVNPGEICGLLGPNGAGKSTTIDSILNFVHPTSGSVTVCGQNPQESPRAVRECIGVLPEATSYHDRATARDHLSFAIKMKRADDDPDRILEKVGIADAAHRSVGEFSKGMRQRLGLALALVGDSSLLILDEPLTGLDPDGARRLRTILRDERETGTAVLLSSHIMAQVEALCDRIAIMHDGELVTVDTVAALKHRVDVSAPVVLSVTEVPTDHQIDRLDGVVNTEPHGSGTRITCRDSTVTGPVVTHLDAAGATIHSIETSGGFLEQLFHAVTSEPANSDHSAQQSPPTIEL